MVLQFPKNRLVWWATFRDEFLECNLIYFTQNVQALLPRKKCFIWKGSYRWGATLTDSLEDHYQDGFFGVLAFTNMQLRPADVRFKWNRACMWLTLAYNTSHRMNQTSLWYIGHMPSTCKLVTMVMPLAAATIPRNASCESKAMHHHLHDHWVAPYLRNQALSQILWYLIMIVILILYKRA